MSARRVALALTPLALVWLVGWRIYLISIALDLALLAVFTLLAER